MDRQQAAARLAELRGAAKQSSDERRIAELAKLRARSPLQYDKRRRETADEWGVRVSAVDEAVRKQQAHSHDEASALPHWNAPPWPDAVSSAELLESIKAEFEKYIMLPAGAADALALWVLHAWTMDAGEISPYLLLVSPTKRCGKTSVMIILLYLTPRSELASNISAAALFRCIEETRPTLLIDEADAFVKHNEEMRSILNAGHIRAAAYVKRTVEIQGEHKPKRFSVWAPKAIASIGTLADTLEDRSVVVQLHRKPKSAKLARLRRRDCEEFALLRRKAARWAADNFDRLRDPDPEIPDALNDRAADNWRPLLAIADLSGGAWPRRAREAACLLSGEGHEVSSTEVDLMADLRNAFGDEPAVATVDLIARLAADPERPWVEWGKNGKPITASQLRDLLKPFEVFPEKIRLPGRKDFRGYRRVWLEELWEAYLPGQSKNPSLGVPSVPCAENTGASPGFLGVPEDPQGTPTKPSSYPTAIEKGDTRDTQPPLNGCDHESDQAEVAPSDDTFGEPDDTFGTALDTSSDDAQTAPAEFALVPNDTRAQVEQPDNGDIPACLRRCEQCGEPSDPIRGAVTQRDFGGVRHWLHERCDFKF